MKKTAKPFRVEVRRRKTWTRAVAPVRGRIARLPGNEPAQDLASLILYGQG